MNARQRAIIVAARRTAVGRVGGLHRHVPLEQLAAPVIRAVLSDAAISTSDADALIMGNAAGPGGNPARVALLAAGLPNTTPAFTVDAQCASGLEAIANGARLIETGAAHIVVAGGAESPSTAPWRVAKPRSLYGDLPAFYHEAPFAPDETGNPTMIEGAENVARTCGIAREEQDAFALDSHRRASSVQARAIAADEIVSLHGTAQEDEGVRPQLSPRLLARMPALIKGGTVTAGNSCSISDGGAFVVIMSENAFHARGHKRGLRVASCAAAGNDPRLPGLAAVPAVRQLFERQPETAARIASIAIIEAFASQVLGTIRLLKLDPALVNPVGGALAIGHPYAASGAILAVQLFSRFVREPREAGRAEGAASLAIAAAAGGIGSAILFQSFG